MTEDLSKSALRVQRALETAGIASHVVELPQSTRTSAEAATAIGCTVGQIAKSVESPCRYRCAGAGPPARHRTASMPGLGTAELSRIEVLGVPLEKAVCPYLALPGTA